MENELAIFKEKATHSSEKKYRISINVLPVPTKNSLQTENTFCLQAWTILI